MAKRKLTGPARPGIDRAMRSLVDALPQFVWIARPDGSISYNNQRLIDYLARKVEQMEGAGWLEAVHPDDRERVWKAWQTAQIEQTYEIEHRLRHGSGAYRWMLVRGEPQRDSQGAILYWVGTCTDIEKQKQVEQQLAESKQNLWVLTEMVPQLVWTARADGQTDYCNQRFCDYTGATAEQLLGYGWRQFVHPDDIAHMTVIRDQAFGTGSPYEVEYRLRENKTGRYRWFLVRAMPIRDEAGQLIKWFGTCTDIEDQKHIEDELRQSQERVNALMNSNVIGISVIEAGRMVDANETFLRMTGYTREDLQAGRLNVMQMTAPEYRERTRQAHQELHARCSLTPYEKEYICQDGSRLPVLVGGTLLRRPSQAIGFVLDNSARKELEQRKDAFISMASHELRNPLTALKLQATLLRRQMDRQGIQASLPALTSMEHQIDIITRLVDDLLDVSKMQAGKLEYVWETIDLDALLGEIVETMRQTRPDRRILLSGAIGATLSGDRDRLGQVFTNLLSNAIKYSPAAEPIEVELSASPEWATVRVRDHGLGIPREQRERIFERFYRIVDARRRNIAGLGMGLYIVAEIVKSHGGSITVESSVGQGSTFTVTLPRCRPAEQK